MTAEGLSCYTGNLAAYLEQYDEDAAGRIARSIRVAVRSGSPDGALAVSHHAVPLHWLPGGGELRYRGSPDRDTALREIAAELDTRGQVLAVGNSGCLPWASGAAAAPHFLLVNEQKDGRCWHVVDRFAALLPEGGEQEPFEGWLEDAAFAGILDPICPLPPQQRLRNEHAFGFPVPLPPEGSYQWLVRVDSDPGQQAGLPGDWTDRPGAALDLLADWFTSGEQSAVLLADAWAIARHHIYRYENLLGHSADDGIREAATRALSSWQRLPQALRFAYESAQRGRARPSLIKTAFGQLSETEDALIQPLAAAGYGAGATIRQEDN